MTVLHPDNETSFLALQACAGVLQGILPGAEQAGIEPITSAEAVDTLAQEGWRAISSRLEGLEATLIFALSPAPATVLLDHLDQADETTSPVTPLFDQLGAMIGESVGVEISVDNSQEISREDVVRLHVHDDALIAALRTTDQVLALLIVRYDDAEGTEGHVPNLAMHEFGPLEVATVTPAIRSLELLSEVEMGVTAELGRTRLLVKDILALTPGSVIELDRAAGSPIDVLVNGTLIARGEVVVIDEEFGIRISEIIGYEADPKGRRR
ncbi:MAG: flagellar motor switch protein FliN [Acidimicrobiales bacterium]